MIIDRIEEVIRDWKKEYDKDGLTSPNFLVLDRLSYAALLDARGMEEEDITEYAGMVVHIEPKDEGKVECI